MITDALTSLLAIVALFGGKLWGANWLDPVMGTVGAILVAILPAGLIKSTANVLLDAEIDKPATERVKKCINARHPDIEITDIHVWRVGKKHYACILSVLSSPSVTPYHVKFWLKDVEELAHITVEINESLTPAA